MFIAAKSSAWPEIRAFPPVPISISKSGRTDNRWIRSSFSLNTHYRISVPMKTNKLDFQNVHTVIGADAVIQGDLTLEGGLIIYGKVEGNVTTRGPVRVGKTGHVVGDIASSDLQLHGQVDGNVTVQDRAVLGPQSVLNGDLAYRRLFIEEGARFSGQCRLAESSSS
ncbi:MAG: polymer-forming cytoskeletal family protein [Candidatus Neomarinimicrobiota bacterium]|nr:MAG: polymer-forming cytoskeletal family protein [Candidatus Neomarinimicrobiota bacterium]